MSVGYIGKSAVVVILSSLIASCSGDSPQVSAYKKQLDEQKSDQKKYIDNRVAVLKNDVLARKQQMEGVLASQQKVIDAASDDLKLRRKELQRSTEMALRDLDRQADTLKKQVDMNAEKAKGKLTAESHPSSLQ